MKIEHTIVTDDGKRFSVGDEIAFKIFNTTSCYMDRYIGKITSITDEYICIKDTEINRTRIDQDLSIPFRMIIPNSFNYVYEE